MSNALGASSKKEQEPHFNFERKASKVSNKFNRINSVKSYASNSTVQRGIQSSSLQFNYFEEGDDK